MAFALPAVSEHSRLRLGLIFLLYVAQGLPLGFFFIGLPAWLAANGATAFEVGGFLSAVSLPWTLKFLNGFVMERLTFLPMGRRRAWLIGSQLVIVAGLIAIAILAPGPRDIALLSALAFIVNVATTFQDVAVDGMAVDLLKEAERPRGNALMFGGQALGMAGAGAATGFGLATFGLAAVAAGLAAVVALLVLLVAVCRERPGERLLPWSAGQASAEATAIQLHAWLPILHTTWTGMIRRPSLLLLVPLMMIGAHDGFYAALSPMMGTGPAGWSAEKVSSLMAMSDLLAGVFAILVVGGLVARFGSRTAAILAGGLIAATGLLLAALEPAWSAGWPVGGFILTARTINVLLTVALAASAMSLCAPAVSATQFGLYMATANLGRTLAAALFGPLDALGGQVAVLMALAATGAIAIGFLLLMTRHEPLPAPLAPV